jgi:hypothetical protein
MTSQKNYNSYSQSFDNQRQINYSNPMTNQQQFIPVQNNQFNQNTGENYSQYYQNQYQNYYLNNMYQNYYNQMNSQKPTQTTNVETVLDLNDQTNSVSTAGTNVNQYPNPNYYGQYYQQLQMIYNQYPNQNGNIDQNQNQQN